MALQVGIVGGGQLARMMIAPAVEMGIDVRVLAEQPGMSAGLAATAVGDYRDLDTVLAFAKDVDVLTFDHEHVPQDVLRGLVAAGVTVHPGPDALAYAQDKIDMRTRLAELGMPQPDWAAVTDAASLDAFIAEHGGRAVVKTPRGGYDGKGVRVVSAADEVADWFDTSAPGGALLVEELVDFRRELAQQVARRPSGELVVYPVVETVQQDGVCAEAVAPAPHSAGRLADVAAEIGEAIATGLGVTGMLAVELFQTGDERLLVNELAMRPHNSGHWTQDGAITSQFEQHLRAVLDLPLGDTALRAPHAVMINILGGPAEDTLAARLPDALAAHPSAKIHTYGKDPRPGRKVGHVNVAGDDLDSVVYEARAAAAFFLD
ncbi:5-(carboxyamino)imidazole ribonucleotide synthase [Microbacterium sp. EYE_5]|uniref:5-(carboxyamino)imidazole ribonucleotide synthase n=1 Tax=unclassified Microbacterium TaxID=2609290 RepID=UPI00200671D0|nr:MULTISPECIES: 5-(carboxyamino)imidazole ribonucleotide synthase [unclassified Microbacterium]MCK6081530.1 5-(carboxyamino)imidazole ribonucleotide synthase [Microbacterium sp. EYE_382]MCK6086800.1 5-(carboxyamino)imidazole ribonucleotide synthase [Microbacterium sp. EYE_384]MCK6123702.1 5-(carboxyamino)imidazole ribonucleotide synthase [Microbacterium sp. EYE_80]MCK6126611.1 5-(carboxyamino)imidazole ribonucleotide synthase [Microbacterium sp. EYE_79]MCK6142484.1 5-(carboxyamino)imidazole r